MSKSLKIMVNFLFRWFTSIIILQWSRSRELRIEILIHIRGMKNELSLYCTLYVINNTILKTGELVRQLDHQTESLIFHIFEKLWKQNWFWFIFDPFYEYFSCTLGVYVYISVFSICFDDLWVWKILLFGMKISFRDRIFMFWKR